MISTFPTIVKSNPTRLLAVWLEAIIATKGLLGVGGQDHRPSGKSLPMWGLSLLHPQVLFFWSRLGFYSSMRVGLDCRLRGAQLALNFQSFQREGRLSWIKG